MPKTHAQIPIKAIGGGYRKTAYKLMPNGNIRAYDPNTADLRGISESQIVNTKNECTTITTAHTAKILLVRRR